MQQPLKTEDLGKRLHRALQSETLNERLDDHVKQCQYLETQASNCFSLAQRSITEFQREVEKVKSLYQQYDAIAKRIRLGGGCTHGADHGPNCYLCLKENGRLTGEFVGYEDGLDVADYCYRHLEKTNSLTPAESKNYLNSLDTRSAKLKSCDNTLRSVNGVLKKLTAVVNAKLSRTPKPRETYTTANLNSFREEEVSKELPCFTSTFIIGDFNVKVNFREEESIEKIRINKGEIYMHVKDFEKISSYLEELLRYLTSLKFDIDKTFRLNNSKEYVLASNLFQVSSTKNYALLREKLYSNANMLGLTETKRRFICQEMKANKEKVILENLNLTVADIKVELLALKYSVGVHTGVFNFSGNQLSSFEFYELVKPIAVKSNFKCFNISYNIEPYNLKSKVDSQQLLQLLKCIQNHTNLTTLDLNACGIILVKEENIVRFINLICEILLSCEKLTFVDISNIIQSPLSKTANEKLNMSILSSDSLQYFYLDSDNYCSKV